MRPDNTRVALLFGVLLGCLTMLGCQGIAREIGRGFADRTQEISVRGEPGQPPLPSPADYSEEWQYKLAVGLNAATWLYFGIRRRWPSIARALEGPKKDAPVTTAPGTST